MTKVCAISGEKCPYWNEEDTKVFCNTCTLAERYEMIQKGDKHDQ